MIKKTPREQRANNKAAQSEIGESQQKEHSADRRRVRDNHRPKRRYAIARGKEGRPRIGMNLQKRVHQQEGQPGSGEDPLVRSYPLQELLPQSQSTSSQDEKRHEEQKEARSQQ